MASGTESTESVNDLFFSTLKLYEKIESSSLDSNSDELQSDIEKCRALLEKLTLLVSQLGLFSDNEEIEELPTPSIKFLLLPAMLGNTTIRRRCLPFRPSLVAEPCASDALPSRDTILRLSKVYFQDFMSRCKDYGVTQREIPKEKEIANGASNAGRPTPEQLQKMSQEREEKIRRFKEKKRLEAQLKQLRQSKIDEDDETTREFYLSWLSLAVIDSLDQLESISMELAMLQRVAAAPPPATAPSPRPNNTSTFRPILLTRDTVQKQVYGVGYPSLPVMTVDELYEQRAKEGWYDKLSGPPSNSCSGGADHHEHDSGPPAEPRPDDEQNSDDEESERNRSRLQQRDEYRDVHRRGWGNTHNRS